jgi:parallel beta-helix repeat protein
MAVQTQSVRFASLAGLLLATSGSLVAGPLNPPPGPITSTYKTLTEVEPRTAINATNTPGDADSLFKITQPGSYYLTGNITGVSGKHGIEIAASDVTIDLGGFTLAGVAGSLDGVFVVSSFRGIVVTSGNVSGWGQHGINAGTFNATMIARQVRAANNTSKGFSAGGRSVFENCTAIENGQIGFDATSGPGCVFTDCQAQSNVGTGILCGSSALVDRCSVYANNGAGINAGTRSVVQGCISNSNTLDGILVASYCTVKNNTCNFNGLGTGFGAGIFVTSVGNVIEDNMCTNADRGIEVDGTSNFIARNTCTLNTLNWEVASSNKCLVVQGLNAGSISGNAGGTSPGSTDPNANFTY